MVYTPEEWRTLIKKSSENCTVINADRELFKNIDASDYIHVQKKRCCWAYFGVEKHKVVPGAEVLPKVFPVQGEPSN